VSNIKLPAGT